MYYDELYHYGIKGQKWGVRRAQTSQLKQVYKKDAKEAKNAHKAYIKSMPKVLGVFRDAGFADKNAERSYEKAKAKADASRYDYELAKSENRGKATKQLVKIHGQREYDRIYDKLSNTNMSQGKIHEKAKAGQRKVEELVKKQKF